MHCVLPASDSCEGFVADEHLLNRIRSEFLEMPGLRLTLQQTQRLCGIERAMCQWTLDTLLDTKFLCITRGGAYARLSDGADSPRPPPAKADLGMDTRVTRSS
jgi:hypothetical protein